MSDQILQLARVVHGVAALGGTAEEVALVAGRSPTVLRLAIGYAYNELVPSTGRSLTVATLEAALDSIGSL